AAVGPPSPNARAGRSTPGGPWSAVRDEDAAGEGGVVGHETVQFREGDAVQDAHEGAGTGSCRRDDVRVPVAGEVAGADVNAPAEGRVEGEGVLQQAPVGTAEDLDQRAAAGARRRYDVGLAIAVHVAGRDEDAAGEGGLVGHELVQQP